jgi:hypothetical protein
MQGDSEEGGGQSWLRDRLDLWKAMKESPSMLDRSECDYVPALEVVGIVIAHATVTRMVLRGELDMASAAYLNAALGSHSFCALHHCVHQSISQHNEQFQPFENMVFRLASAVIFFDDGYREAHTAHHQRTNEPDDPDLVLSHTSLPVLGDLIHALVRIRTMHCNPQPMPTTLTVPHPPRRRHLCHHPQVRNPTYLSIGAAITPFKAAVIYNLGLSSLLSTGIGQMGVNWDNQVTKMACFDALKVLEEGAQAGDADYAALRQTLQGTWRTSQQLSITILALFFAR